MTWRHICYVLDVMVAERGEPTVLIVDDDEHMLRGLELLVKAEGFDVRSAASLAEARAAIEAEAPDILLSDVLLPDGLGTDLIDELDQERTAVVLVSGRMGAEKARQALSRGAHEYLGKPVDLERLRAILSQLRRGRS